jgi:hypothetical protein
MNNDKKALKLALEALEGVLDNSPKVLDASISGGLYEVVQCREAINAIKEALAQEQEPTTGNILMDSYKAMQAKKLTALPEQEPVAWKLMPRDATDSMLKAMDECSTEGYDERLYAGHAASVYMAAWDAYPDINQKQEPVLQDIEQYRMQVAGICTAAIGYWKEGDGIHSDYDTLALRDVAKLYAKYDALYKTQPVPHAVIAGALFDFMGWLTSRKERLVLSSADEASPAVDAIRDFAKMRGLSLDDAKVQDWQDMARGSNAP